MCCTSGIFFSSARTASIRPRVSSNEASGAVLNLIWNSAWSGFAMNSDCSVPKRPMPADEGDRREREDRLPVVERPGDEPLVAVRRPVEPVVEAVEGARDGVPVPDPLDVGVDPARGEHRVEGEGDEEGDEDREGDRDPELEEEAPHDPLHEGDRDEDGDDGERRREDREADLGRADAGRRHVVLPLLEVPHDVLPDDDRVVDEEADRERERHERHDVQRHPEEVHDDERGDDRDRERQPGDDGRAPGVEEEEDDQDRQDPADDQGVRHVVDGLLDHDRAVPHELDLDGGRELAPELGRSPSSPPRRRRPCSPCSA